MASSSDPIGSWNLKLPAVPRPERETTEDLAWPVDSMLASFKPSEADHEVVKHEKMHLFEPLLMSNVDLLAEMTRMQTETSRRRRETLELIARDTSRRLMETMPLGLPTRSFAADLLKPVPRTPKDLPKYDLDQLLAKGLEPCGETFSRDGLTLNMMQSEQTPEAVLLKDQAVVDRLQGTVLSTLARLGPLSLREMVYVTGLPEDLLDVFVAPTNDFSRPEEKASSLMNSHRGLLSGNAHSGFRLNQPDDLLARQLEAGDQARQHILEAEKRLEDARELFALARPELAQHTPDLAQLLSPGERKSSGALFETMRTLDLVDQSSSEQEWRQSWAGEPRQYWLGISTTLADRVVSALHPLTGYEQLYSRMSKDSLCVDKSALDGLWDGLKSRFSGLAGRDLADMMDTSFHLANKSLDKPTALAAELGQAMRQPVDHAFLEQFAVDLQAQRDRLAGIEDERIPSPAAIAAERAEKERQLTTPEQWGAYLEAEYQLPHKIQTRLQSLEGVDRALVAEALPLSKLSPEVADGVRSYLRATVEGNAEAREGAVRRLLRMKGEKLLGKSEFGEREIPNVRVSRKGGSFGGGSQGRYIDHHYYGLKSRDGEAVRGLLGISQDAQSQQFLLSQTMTRVPFSNDNLLEDLVTARVLGQTARQAELEEEALSLVACSAAYQFTGLSREDPLNRDTLGSPIPAATGFGFREIDRARKLGLAAARVRQWARQNEREFPLSPRDLQAASKNQAAFSQAEAEDAEGIDFALVGKLARQGVTELPLDSIHQLVGSDPAPFQARVDRLATSGLAWVEQLDSTEREQALWRILQTRGEPTVEQGEAFGKLMLLYRSDVEKSLAAWNELEARVEQGESRQEVLASYFKSAIGVAATDAPAGGIAELGSGLVVGGTLLRARRRS